jgi:hypothetical protein
MRRPVRGKPVFLSEREDQSGTCLFLFQIVKTCQGHACFCFGKRRLVRDIPVFVSEREDQLRTCLFLFQNAKTSQG